MKAIVVTTGHHEADARLNRHTAALRSAGFTTALEAPGPSRPARFLGAPFIVWRILQRHRPAIAIYPDPELFVAGPIVGRLLGVRVNIIDIHEDYHAAAASRTWIPRPLRPVAASIVRVVERLGRRLASFTVVAADGLALGDDVVVPNLPDMSLIPDGTPSSQRRSIVYVGDITPSRGLEAMLALVEKVPDVRLELIGAVSGRARAHLDAWESGGGPSHRVQVLGRLPYPETWARAAGAVAGLSLLEATPAYEDAVPSKLWDYMAVGLPVLASDLRAQRRLVEQSGCGVVVKNVEAAADILTMWLGQPDMARTIGEAGRRHALERAGGAMDSYGLVEKLEHLIDGKGI